MLTPSLAMPPELESMSYELHMLRAAADGVQPALLLKAPGKKAEYLFNVPDGFSRLAMEEKLTPSARLSCVLLNCLLPASTGGLGGLLLRLKHDGHGQIQLIAPQGSSSITHSLRHICRWQHPKVFVSECCNSGPVPVFEDEYIVIVPLLAGDQSTGCPWCLYASSERPTASRLKKVPLTTTSELHNDSSSTDSSGSEFSVSDDDTSPIGFGPSKLDRSGDSFEKSLSSFNVCSEMGNDPQSIKKIDTLCKLYSHESIGATVDRMPHFCHTQREGCDLKEFGNLLPQQRKRDAGHHPLLDFYEGFSGRVRVKKMKPEQDSGKVLGGSKSGSTPNLSLQNDDDKARILPKEKASEDGSLMSNPKGSRMIDGAEASPASSRRAELPKSSFVQSTKPYEWLISNSYLDNLPQLADDSNPVYGRHPSTQAEVISGEGIEKDRKPNEAGDSYDSYEGNPARVLGYVSYLRKLSNAILFVDCRGMEDLESLRRHPALSCLYHTSGSHKDDEANMSSKMHTISATVHLTPHILVQSSDYQSWMSSMRSPAHVVMNERSPEFGFRSSLAMLQRLNNIHQDIFPLPFNMETNSRTTHLTQEFISSNVTIVDARLSMCLRFCADGATLSHASVDYSVHPLSLEKIRALPETSEQVPEELFAKAEAPRSDGSAFSHPSLNVLAAVEIKKMLLQQKEKILSRPSSGLSHSEDDRCEDVDRAFSFDNEVAAQVVLNDNQPISLTPVQKYVQFHDPGSEFQLIFLGTGCAEPSKNRGSSSILVQVRGAEGAMLLDAGEGAAGQLFRRFGEQAARTVISSLQCVWLSHKHGDHVLGVLSILQMRSSQAPPLVVIGPRKVHQWLSEVRDTCSARGYPVPQFTYIHCDELSHSEQYNNNQQHARELLEVLNAMQLSSILSVKVFHCHDAYGIILNGRRGWKVVYSGDTRPCKQLIEAGQGCTLLIHEATFEDTLIEQAKCKRHSTVSEAVIAGWQMRAHHIILTHFSQRYPEMVTLSESKENLCVAFDGMVVPSQLLGLLGKLLPKIRIACQRTVSIPSITETGEQRNEGTAKSMPIGHSESATQQNSVRESLVAKHTRWLSDSDDEATDDCPDGDAISTSVKWSSESDEEAEFREQGGLLTRNVSRDPTAEIFCKRNSHEGRCETAYDSFEGIVSTSAVQRASLEGNCEVDGPPSNTRETAGPLGGKHLRWIESDSEDG